MKKSRFTESQILKIIGQHDDGMKVADICREHGISQPTFHRWKSQYSGMSSSQLKKLKEMESELAQYKKMYAELAHQNYVLKDVIEKKL